MSSITLDSNQLSQMLTTAAELGASKFAIKNGLVKTKISRAEANKRYSRRLVDRWLKSGKISPVKIGGRILLSVEELEAVSNIDELCFKHFSK